VAARDVEGDHDPITGLDVCDVRAHLLDDAHGFVPEDVAGIDERSEEFVEVKIGAADRGRGDAHDGVGRLLHRRIGDVLDAYVTTALPSQRLHVFSNAFWPDVADRWCGHALPGRRREKPANASVVHGVRRTPSSGVRDIVRAPQ